MLPNFEEQPSAIFESFFVKFANVDPPTFWKEVKFVS